MLRRQTREYSHTVLFKTVCHLVQKVQSEHMQADLQEEERENMLLALDGGRMEGEQGAKNIIIHCSNNNGGALLID